MNLKTTRTELRSANFRSTKNFKPKKGSDHHRTISKRPSGRREPRIDLKKSTHLESEKSPNPKSTNTPPNPHQLATSDCTLTMPDYLTHPTPDFLPPLAPRTNPSRMQHLESQIHLLNTYLLSITPSQRCHRIVRLLEIQNLDTLIPSAQKYLDDRRFSRWARRRDIIGMGGGCDEDEEDKEDEEIAKLLSQRSRLVVYLSNKMVLPLSMLSCFA